MLVLVALTLCVPASQSRRKPQTKSEFDRTQYMVMNLNRGKDSTGYYLQESHRSSVVVLQQLEKAQRQLEQVDRAYAKSRGRPDDKYLNDATERIRAAKATAEQLTKELSECQEGLKNSIHQVLLLEQ